MTEALEAQTTQRDGAKRATFDRLRSKKPNEREFTIKLSGDDEQVSFLFRAIGAVEYEKLITRYPPSTEQKAEGGTYDPDRFAPALLSRVCVEPAMTEAEWAELWKSGDWSRGETADIFFAAVNLCSRGLQVDPSAAG